MAKCSVCGKGVVFGNNVSHSHRKTNRTWKPNIRRVKAIVEDGAENGLCLFSLPAFQQDHACNLSACGFLQCNINPNENIRIDNRFALCANRFLF